MIARFSLAGLLLCIAMPFAFAQEAEEQDELPAQEAAANGDGVDTPKTMSGMSILGNEEAPKSLVIVPWKSSEMGDEQSMSDSLDDQARPVDKEVFLRELRFFEIRAGNDEDTPAPE